MKYNVIFCINQALKSTYKKSVKNNITLYVNKYFVRIYEKTSILKKFTIKHKINKYIKQQHIKEKIYIIYVK